MYNSEHGCPNCGSVPHSAGTPSGSLRSTGVSTATTSERRSPMFSRGGRSLIRWLGRVASPSPPFKHRSAVQRWLHSRRSDDRVRVPIERRCFLTKHATAATVHLPALSEDHSREVQVPNTARSSRGYDVTPAGQVVVNADQLANSDAVKKISRLAEEIVRYSRLVAERQRQQQHSESKKTDR